MEYRIPRSWYLIALLLFLPADPSLADGSVSCSSINLSEKIMPPLNQGSTGTCATMTISQLLSYWNNGGKIDPFALTFSLSQYSAAKSNSFIRAANGANTSVMSNVIKDLEKPRVCGQSIFSSDQRYLVGPELAQFAAESSGILSSITILHKQFQKLPPNPTASQVKQMILDLLPALHFPYVENGKIQRFIPSERRTNLIRQWCRSKLFPDNAIEGERLCADFTKTFDHWVNKLHIICGKGLDGEVPYSGDLLCPSKEDLVLVIATDLGASVNSPTEPIYDHFNATNHWPMYGVKENLATPFSVEVRNKIASAMAPRVCLQSAPFPEKIDTYVGTGSVERSPERVINLVNHTLNAGVPVYLSLDTCGSLFPEKTCKGKDYHAVTVYGRTMHNGSCGYLIRNSWGNRSSIYDKSPLARAVQGSDGDFWLSQSAFYKRNQYDDGRPLAYYAAAFLSMQKNTSPAPHVSPGYSGNNVQHSYENSKAYAPTPASPMEY